MSLYHKIKVLVPSLRDTDFLPKLGCVSIRNDGGVEAITKWEDDKIGRSQPTQAELDSVADDANIYEGMLAVRASRIYPSLEDQADALVKGGSAWDSMKSACLSVKDKHQFTAAQLAFKIKYPTL